MRFDQISAQFPQRPARIRLPHLARRLIRQAHDGGFLASGQSRRRSCGLPLRHPTDPSRRKRFQIGVDRVDMHALRFRDLQGAQPHAVEHQRLRPTLLVGIRQASHQLAQPVNFDRGRATDFQSTSHGIAS
jgi:hypothetical protein